VSTPTRSLTWHDSHLGATGALADGTDRTARDGARAGDQGLPSAARRDERRRLVARSCWVWAVVSLAAEFTPLGYWLDGWLPDYAVAATWLLATPSVGLALLLVVLASGLRRGRRLAFWLLTTCLVAVGPLGWLGWSLLAGDAPGAWPGWFWAAVTTHLVLLSWLVRQRWAFQVPSHRLGAARTGAMLTGAAGVSVMLGVSVVELTDQGHASRWQRVLYGTQRMVADTGLWSGTGAVRVPWWTNLLVNLIAAITLAVLLYLLLRSPRPATAMRVDDEQRLRELLAQHGGRDSLGYFSLRRDKRVLFSASGKAAICYRVLGGVSLAAGDPIGDPEAWPAAMTAWAAEAEAHGWRSAVLGASEQAATVYRRVCGLDALELGDEAIIDTATFSIGGRAMRGIRQAHARIGRAGYTVTLARQSQLTQLERREIRQSAETWRLGGRERGFSMALGRLGDPADSEYVVVRCRDDTGQLRGVLGFVPWGRRGLSLDLMRRDRTADNGLFEYMIVELLLLSHDWQVEQVSLNFAMFRSVFETGARIGAGPMLRAQRRLLCLASRWWQLESLYRANVKYQPRWQPRYISFGAPTDLPAVLTAAGRVEGFLP